MQQNQPQPEFGQDHIVRRLISKFRKPSDASAIGVPASISSASNTLQVPGSSQLGGQMASVGHDGLALSAAELTKSTSSEGEPAQSQPALPMPSIAARLATKQSRWSQLVASAAASAATKPAAAATSAASGSQVKGPTTGADSEAKTSASIGGDSGGSNRSSADKDQRAPLEDDIDENYFRAGGRGHQTILENMERR